MSISTNNNNKMNKCTFCRQTGHCITRCEHPSIAVYVSRLESSIPQGSLVDFMGSCSSAVLSVLCAHYGLGVSGTIGQKTNKLDVYLASRRQMPSVASRGPAIVVENPDMVADMLSDMSDDADVDDAYLQYVQGVRVRESLSIVVPTPDIVVVPIRLPPRTPDGSPPVSMSMLMTLTPESSSELARLKREHQEFRDALERRSKMVGERAYQNLKRFHESFDVTIPHETRLSLFRIRKDEVLRDIYTLESPIEYIDAMMEYNRLLEASPLYIVIPLVVARPVVGALHVETVGERMDRRMRSLRLDVSVVDDDDVPISQLRRWPAAATLAAVSIVQPPVRRQAVPSQAVPSQAVPRRTPSVAQGKSYLNMLQIVVRVDASLDTKVPKKKKFYQTGEPEEAVLPENECQICTAPFSRSKAPKTMLNCGHDMCATCVVNVAKGRTKHEICCPFCREDILCCTVGTDGVMTKLDWTLKKL